ncbi:MAG: dihydrolipoamide acetyltransferase family protein, partial [Gemmatimonadaceae bacterium]
MATKVFMEALSPTMEEGRLVNWLKQEGDAVKPGDVLAEVETDKAVMELAARGEGVLRKQLVAAGTTAAVGTLVGVIAGKDEDIAALLGGGSASAAAAPAASAAVAPSTTPAAAPSAALSAAPAPAANPSVPAAPGTAAPAAPAGRVVASPLARRLAGDAGVDLGVIHGSGPGGRIVKRDIEAAMASGAAAPSAAGHPSAASRAAAPVRTGAGFRDEPLTQIRKTIARRLSESIGPIPTFYLTAEFDLTRAAEMRAAAAELGDAYKFSFNDLILKATATALTKHPEVNAHWLGDRIRYFESVHLGMAVATGDGLIVPVIFDADSKGMGAIAAEAKSLAKKARERKLKPEEFTGSTFSVSNLGMMQIDQFTAII